MAKNGHSVVYVSLCYKEKKKLFNVKCLLMYKYKCINYCCKIISFIDNSWFTNSENWQQFLELFQELISVYSILLCLIPKKLFSY